MLDCQVFSFADDTAILFSETSWEGLRETISKNLKLILDWFNEHLLTINITKTKYLPFCSYESHLPPFEYIEIEGTDLKIESASTIKYLGVTLDSHLKWKYHIDSLCKKLRGLIYTFKQLKNILNRQQLITIYYGLIESQLNYGILVWGGAGKVNLEPLEKLQKRFLKIIYNKDYYYSTELLYNESKLLTVRKLYCKALLIYQFKQIKNITEQTDLTLSYSYRTRNKEKGKLLVPRAQKTIGQKSFTYLAPRLYNNVPTTFKIYTYTKFKHVIKK